MRSRSSRGLGRHTPNGRDAGVLSSGVRTPALIYARRSGVAAARALGPSVDNGSRGVDGRGSGRSPRPPGHAGGTPKKRIIGVRTASAPAAKSDRSRQISAAHGDPESMPGLRDDSDSTRTASSRRNCSPIVPQSRAISRRDAQPETGAVQVFSFDRPDRRTFRTEEAGWLGAAGASTRRESEPGGARADGSGASAATGLGLASDSPSLGSRRWANAAGRDLRRRRRRPRYEDLQVDDQE